MYDNKFYQYTDATRDYYRELTEERNVVFNNDDLNIIGLLNFDQLFGFNSIMDSVINKRGRVFSFTALEVLGKHFCTKRYLPRFVLRD
jgi:hypothetical protein